MAKEMSEMTKFKILNEAGISMFLKLTKHHKWFLNYYNKHLIYKSLCLQRDLYITKTQDNNGGS